MFGLMCATHTYTLSVSLCLSLFVTHSPSFSLPFSCCLVVKPETVHQMRYNTGFWSIHMLIFPPFSLPTSLYECARHLCDLLPRGNGTGVGLPVWTSDVVASINFWLAFQSTVNLIEDCILCWCFQIVQLATSLNYPPASWIRLRFM